MSSYKEMAYTIHETARSKGFWDKERDFGEMIMLAISELAEALEEHREERPPIWYKHEEGCKYVGTLSLECCNVKPEGAGVELADCVIRCLDTLYDMQINNKGFYPFDIDFMIENEYNLRDYVGPNLEPNFGAALRTITKTLARTHPVTPLPLIQTIVSCERLCARLGLEIREVMLIKMNYNSTRPHMHGKAY